MYEKTCPECKSLKIENDIASGLVICRKCGLIFEKILFHCERHGRFKKEMTHFHNMIDSRISIINKTIVISPKKKKFNEIRIDINKIKRIIIHRDRMKGPEPYYEIILDNQEKFFITFVSTLGWSTKNLHNQLKDVLSQKFGISIKLGLDRSEDEDDLVKYVNIILDEITTKGEIFELTDTDISKVIDKVINRFLEGKKDDILFKAKAGRVNRKEAKWHSNLFLPKYKTILTWKELIIDPGKKKLPKIIIPLKEIETVEESYPSFGAGPSTKIILKDGSEPYYVAFSGTIYGYQWSKNANFFKQLIRVVAIYQTIGIVLHEAIEERQDIKYKKKLEERVEGLEQITYEKTNFAEENEFEFWMKSLESAEDKFREEAIISLGTLGDKRALPYLEKLLNDDSKSIRELSKKAIKDIKNKD